MKTIILGLLAETFIHPGSGQDTGFIDLPVAREAATDYPVIMGSSFKGALRDRARSEKIDRIDKVFGESDNEKESRAGELIVSDIRLLALPVRSLTGAYKWVTCPHLLERFQRDMKRTGSTKDFKIPEVKDGKYLGEGNEKLFLEEREFSKQNDLLDPKLIKHVQSLILNEDAKKRVDGYLVVVSDDDFAWFARYGLAINARNQLDEITKSSKNLWYEETLAPDSLFYSLLAERKEGALESVGKLFSGKPYIQVGGNETIGQGWFAVAWDITYTQKGGN